MPIQDMKIKKRIPNIILGLIFGLLALYFTPSCWSYFFFILSALAFTFTDKVIKAYIINIKTGHYYLNGSDVKMTHKDKDGNIKSQS